MLSSEDRPVKESAGAQPSRGRRAAAPPVEVYTGSIRTAPLGAHSRIGDDETHRRLQAARNQATHSTENLIRRVLGPEWV